MGEVIAFAPRRARPVASEQLRSAPATEAGAETRSVQTPSISAPSSAAPLWREVVGDVLRGERRRQHRTLADVAARAGMSVQYLSELERGRKEASSEMLAAACGSLGLDLARFAERCAGAIARSGRPTGPVLLAA